MGRAATAMLGGTLGADRERPWVVSLHSPAPVSGINSWGGRMTRLDSRARWHVLVVGEELTAVRAATAAGDAASWSVAMWGRGAGAVEQVRAVRGALRELGAAVVAPNDVAHGFVCAGLDHHRGLRSLAVCHACSGATEDFYGRVGPLADAWIPVSGRARNRLGPLMGWGDRAPPVVPCGVVVAPGAPPPSPEPGPLRLLYAGRLDQHCKRVLDLPVLCAHLTALGADWRLKVAGDGSAWAELARGLAPFVAAGRAEMLGVVAGADMGRLYAESDCLILLSAFEGWPVTVIEAMAAARPVAITAGCGGALDVVRDGAEGFIVPTGDMRAMARRLAGLDRAAIARMGAAAHSTAKARLDLRALVPAYDRAVGLARSAPGVDAGDWRAVAAAWGRVLEGFGAIDAGAPTEDILSLQSEWLDDLGAGRGRRGAVLPVVIPERCSFASACFLKAMERLRGKGVARVVLYGAGRHTRRLERILARTPEAVAIVDDRAGMDAPESLLGLPVVGPSQWAGLRAGAVIVSSDEHQEAMAARAGEWAGAAPVVRLYGPDGYAA